MFEKCRKKPCYLTVKFLKNDLNVDNKKPKNNYYIYIYSYTFLFVQMRCFWLFFGKHQSVLGQSITKQVTLFDNKTNIKS